VDAHSRPGFRPTRTFDRSRMHRQPRLVDVVIIPTAMTCFAGVPSVTRSRKAARRATSHHRATISTSARRMLTRKSHHLIVLNESRCRASRGYDRAGIPKKSSTAAGRHAGLSRQPRRRWRSDLGLRATRTAITFPRCERQEHVVGCPPRSHALKAQHGGTPVDTSRRLPPRAHRTISAGPKQI